MHSSRATSYRKIKETVNDILNEPEVRETFRHGEGKGGDLYDSNFSNGPAVFFLCSPTFQIQVQNFIIKAHLQEIELKL